MRIDVCLSPAMVSHFDLTQYEAGIMTDVFRASSHMVNALENGIEHIRIFDDVEACRKMRDDGYLIAGERGGEPIAGFDLGNSPLAYTNARFAGKKLAMTTTNGTRALLALESIPDIYVGAMLNIDAVADKIKKYESCLILCAGWKNRPNIEDSCFAGGIIERAGQADHSGDEGIIVRDIYNSWKENTESIKKAHHFKRLEKLQVMDDLDFCMQENVSDLVPRYASGTVFS